MPRLKSLIPLFPLPLLACLFVGCQTTSLPDLPEAPALPGQAVALPPLTVVYYPYGPSLARDLAQPQPPFAGLTNRRIDVDRRQLDRVGITGILLRLDPDTIKNAERHPRLVTIAERMATGDAPLRTTFQLVTTGLTSSELASLLQHLRAAGLHTFPGYRRLGGEPLIEYLGNLPADYSPVPGIALRPAPQPTTAPTEGVAFNPATGTAFMLVCKRSGDQWDPNRHPRPFKRRLKNAADFGPREIRLDAWNNFATGAFLQSSVDYGRDLLEALEELRP